MTDTQKFPLPLEWSPVESERIWQQAQFRRIFPNLENDQPNWQRLNFFINAALELYKINESSTKIFNHEKTQPH